MKPLNQNTVEVNKLIDSIIKIAKSKWTLSEASTCCKGAILKTHQAYINKDISIHEALICFYTDMFIHRETVREHKVQGNLHHELSPKFMQLERLLASNASPFDLQDCSVFSILQRVAAERRMPKDFQFVLGLNLLLIEDTLFPERRFIANEWLFQLLQEEKDSQISKHLINMLARKFNQHTVEIDYEFIDEAGRHWKYFYTVQGALVTNFCSLFKIDEKTPINKQFLWIQKLLEQEQGYIINEDLIQQILGDQNDITATLQYIELILTDKRGALLLRMYQCLELLIYFNKDFYNKRQRIPRQEDAFNVLLDDIYTSDLQPEQKNCFINTLMILDFHEDRFKHYLLWLVENLPERVNDSFRLYFMLPTELQNQLARMSIDNQSLFNFLCGNEKLDLLTRLKLGNKLLKFVYSGDYPPLDEDDILLYMRLVFQGINDLSDNCLDKKVIGYIIKLYTLLPQKQLADVQSFIFESVQNLQSTLQKLNDRTKNQYKIKAIGTWIKYIELTENNLLLRRYELVDLFQNAETDFITSGLLDQYVSKSDFLTGVKGDKEVKTDADFESARTGIMPLQYYVDLSRGPIQPVKNIPFGISRHAFFTSFMVVVYLDLTPRQTIESINISTYKSLFFPIFYERPMIFSILNSAMEVAISQRNTLLIEKLINASPLEERFLFDAEKPWLGRYDLYEYFPIKLLLNKRVILLQLLKKEEGVINPGTVNHIFINKFKEKAKLYMKLERQKPVFDNVFMSMLQVIVGEPYVLNALLEDEEAQILLRKIRLPHANKTILHYVCTVAEQIDFYGCVELLFKNSEMRKIYFQRDDTDVMPLELLSESYVFKDNVLEFDDDLFKLLQIYHCVMRIKPDGFFNKYRKLIESVMKVIEHQMRRINGEVLNPKLVNGEESEEFKTYQDLSTKSTSEIVEHIMTLLFLIAEQARDSDWTSKDKKLADKIDEILQSYNYEQTSADVINGKQAGREVIALKLI